MQKQHTQRTDSTLTAQEAETVYMQTAEQKVTYIHLDTHSEGTRVTLLMHKRIQGVPLLLLI